MRYFAKYDENNILLYIGTGCGGTEITEAEYNRLLAEIREKATLVDKLYGGEITLDDVPAEWREEIQRRADERKYTETENELPKEDEVTLVSE